MCLGIFENSNVQRNSDNTILESRAILMSKITSSLCTTLPVTAFLFVNKELQRVNREVLETLNNKGVVFIFPAVRAMKNTALVLKEPKTKTSTRRVFISTTVAEMLKQRKAKIEEYKALYGDEFADYNLVFCHPHGRPIEGVTINSELNKLIKDNNLPPVVFHSLRHSSITYKLKLNGGDMKSVQGDSGHAQVKMVADVYSHIIDEDRRVNAQRFEENFYKRKEESQTPIQSSEEQKSDDNSELVSQLMSNPELLAVVKTVLENYKPKN